tara:strand:- start:87 stop:266 length:180 start_codon:yes stop_codon:yes gene_type:complete
MVKRINQSEYRLIKYCLDNAMVNLHADTRKIADEALVKLKKQYKKQLKIEKLKKEAIKW